MTLDTASAAERPAIDPESIDAHFLRGWLRDRRIYQHGTYGRRRAHTEIRRRVERIRARRKSSALARCVPTPTGVSPSGSILQVDGRGGAQRPSALRGRP